MKPLLPLRSVLMLVALTLYFAPDALGQCNVNDKYDKVVSGYHASIALKDNGIFSIWGAGISSTGTDVGTPQDINSTNYSNLTGTVLKAAIGGSKSSTTVDQAIVLTSDGLWAWGIKGSVLSTSICNSNSSTKIASGSALPSGITPDSVSSLFATYQTLLILTKGGNVYVLTQTNQYVEANGGTGAVTYSWKRVKINSTTYLTNVNSVRGQVSSGSYNAFIALTNDGKLYTWGNSTYLGDGSNVAARNYATQMTMPAEFSSALPKMIAMTGGIGSTATTNNSYYLLANSGKLYALGDNTQRQLGDFTTTERKSWVTVKVSSGTDMTTANFISAQEHNNSYPAVSVVTTNGTLYTWGNNSNGMLGRTDDGTSGGVVGTQYDPGEPVITAGGAQKAVSSEMGGHTLVFIKEGSSHFCYVGHHTNGSMGDGTVTSASPAQTYYATCSATPSLNICGYVPISASPVLSSISSDLNTLVGNGSSSTYIRIRLKDASGVNLTSSGGIVILSSTIGTLSSVSDNNDGTYTALLTSPMTATPTSTTISYTINGSAGSNTVNVSFSASGLLPVLWKTYRATRVGQGVTVSWSTIEDAQVEYYRLERSLNGVSWKTVGPKIPAQLLPGTNYYTRADEEHIATQVYYRIQQTDKDGSSNYSPVIQIGPDGTPVTETISVFPFPATTSFKLGNTSPDKLTKVQVFNMNGTLLKTWATPQGEYGINELPKGMYLLKVELKDGATQQLRLSKN